LRAAASALIQVKAPEGGPTMLPPGDIDMLEPQFVDPTFEPKGEQVEAHMSITLDDRVERIWGMLTRPEHLAQWLAEGEIEPKAGGRARLNFDQSYVVIDSIVTAYDPPRLLEYGWSSPGEPVRPARWVIEPVGGVARLDLTLTLPASEDVARSCAGWAAHLEMLAAALAGAPTKFPLPTFKAARAAYDAKLARVRAAQVAR
jgi:uncharacterized protein YndB with AHSA1/START domain